MFPFTKADDGLQDEGFDVAVTAAAASELVRGPASAGGGGMFKVSCYGPAGFVGMKWRLGTTALVAGEGSFLANGDSEVVYANNIPSSAAANIGDANNQTIQFIRATGSTEDGYISVVPEIIVHVAQQDPRGGFSTPAGNVWQMESSAGVQAWFSVTYGAGLFVAVAYDGQADAVMTSPDGVTWTLRSVPAGHGWNSVVYGGGQFVAVSYAGEVQNVMTSPDGIVWTLQTGATTNSWYSVTYGAGLYVAVGDGGGVNLVMTSPNGVLWTQRVSPAGNWRSVTFAIGLFVAVAANGDVITSPDGIVWTLQVAGVTTTWESVIYANGLFVAVGLGGGGVGAVMTSPDGFVWTIISFSVAIWNSVIYGNGVFVAVSYGGEVDNVMVSPNGTSWTLRQGASISPWASVAYADVDGVPTFVAVSDDGSVMISQETTP